jgi:photosystem II stability/assembly factor-like uncharacterized protein
MRVKARSCIFETRKAPRLCDAVAPNVRGWGHEAGQLGGRTWDELPCRPGWPSRALSHNRLGPMSEGHEQLTAGQLRRHPHATHERGQLVLPAANPPPRRLDVHLGVVVSMCLALVAGCAVLPTVPTPTVTGPATTSTTTGPDASLVPTSASVPTTIDDAGVTGSGAVWVIRGNVLAISGDIGDTWATGSIPLPPPETIGRVVFVLDAAHAWSLTATEGSQDSRQGPDFDHVHLVVNRTSDGGKTWQQASVPGDYPDTGRSLFFLDSARGFLMISGGRTNGSSSTLLRTDDGGATWAVVRTIPDTETPTVTSPASLGSQMTATDRRTIWAAAQPEAGGINHPILDLSRDGGATWSRVALPGVIDRFGGTNNMPLGPPVFLDARTGFFGLIADADSPLTLVFGTNDGGRSWSRLSALPTALAVPIAFTSPSHWLATEQGLPAALDATDDGGTTWHPLEASGLPAGSLERLQMLDPTGGIGVLLTQGKSGMPSVLVRTDDGGRTWTTVDAVGGG